MENRQRRAVAGGAVATSAAVALATLAVRGAWAQTPPGSEEPLLQAPGPVAPLSPPAPPPDAGAPPHLEAPPPHLEAPPPHLEAPPPPPAAGPLIPAPVAEPAPAEPTPSMEGPSPRGGEFDRWPIEFVRRPQTLPAGMFEVALGGSAFRPDPIVMVDPRTGVLYMFHPSLTLGGALGYGMTNMSEFNLSLPRVFCFDTGVPSSCSPFNRYNGTGIDFEVALLRAPRAQLEIQSGISVGVSAPVILRWFLAANAKVLVARWLALRAAIEIAAFANPPAQVPNPLIGYAALGADLQATRQLRLYGVLTPWGSVGDVVQGIELEVRGGLSFSFTNRLETSLEVGATSVLPQPVWSRSVPGRFAGAALALWYD